ncbi:MAG: 4-hydroxythreonine-4-phosphate dehydrogenase PdxA [Acidobacteriota bacterium]
MRRRRKLASPRLALAGLNPHAGEAGLLGSEETATLVPAQQAAVRAGYRLAGPLPADSLFRRAYDGEFDGVVALYHDQGLIPVKMLGLGAAVNVTLGLRVPRTSPDHGTAFDRVGSAEVRSEGMVAALRMAAQLAAS